MISIIIPAHNEELVISRGLAALSDGAREGELEIIVVCNGCTDQTAEMARKAGPLVRVIDTPTPGKANALNLGDAQASGFPRFFIDADVVLTLAQLRMLCDKMAQSGALAVAPLPTFVTSGCAWAVKAYYDIHQRLPAYSEGIGGSGVYGLSEKGRAKFNQFPPVIADDGFVRLQFTPGERLTVRDCHSLVYAPRTVAELIAIKTRSFRGTAQLRQIVPDLFKNIGPKNSASLLGLGLRSWLWPRLAAYAIVKVSARIRARRLGSGSVNLWERDQTSRNQAP
jgi:hypothetical protein